MNDKIPWNVRSHFCKFSESLGHKVKITGRRVTYPRFLKHYTSPTRKILSNMLKMAIGKYESQAKAISELGHTGDSRVIDTLYFKMDHEYAVGLLRCLLHAIGRIGLPSSLDHVLPYLRDKPEWKQHAALYAIANIRHSEACRIIGRAFRGLHREAKKTAASVLWMPHDRRAITSLAMMLLYNDVEVQERALRSMILLAPDELRKNGPSLIKLVSKANNPQWIVRTFKSCSKLLESSEIRKVLGAAIDTPHFMKIIRLLQSYPEVLLSEEVKPSILKRVEYLFEDLHVIRELREFSFLVDDEEIHTELCKKVPILAQAISRIGRSETNFKELSLVCDIPLLYTHPDIQRTIGNLFTGHFHPDLILRSIKGNENLLQSRGIRKGIMDALLLGINAEILIHEVLDIPCLANDNEIQSAITQSGRPMITEGVST